MAAIDDRAKGLNESLARPDEEPREPAPAKAKRAPRAPVEDSPERIEEQGYARKSGRGGLTRKSVGSRRKDLMDAYDEGAAERESDEAEDPDDEDEDQGEDDADEGTAPAPRPAGDSGAALSAGVVLGFLAYSLVIQVVRGGKAQLKGWLKAKLINVPLPVTGQNSSQAQS